MKVIKAPNFWVRYDTHTPVIFLAGSIEMGKAENWQQRFEKHFANEKVTILNPRRDDWDSSWKQTIDDPQFSQQVLWELDGLDRCDVVAMRFDPTTQSPITLLELGLCASNRKKAIYVCCPEGFWRKGNVEIVCQKYSVPFFTKESQWLEMIIGHLRELEMQRDEHLPS